MMGLKTLARDTRAIFAPNSNRAPRPDMQDGLLLAAAILLLVALVGVILSTIVAGISLVLHIAVGLPLGHPLADPAWHPFSARIIGLVVLAIIAGGISDILRVIASVARHEPFAAENAGHIERLAWRLVQLQGMALIARWAHVGIGGDVNGFDISIGFSGNTIVFALILFVLARVFRHGNRLQDEIEGTV